MYTQVITRVYTGTLLIHILTHVGPFFAFFCVSCFFFFQRTYHSSSGIFMIQLYTCFCFHPFLLLSVFVVVTYMIQVYTLTTIIATAAVFRAACPTWCW